jgi:hypothetical protein
MVIRLDVAIIRNFWPLLRSWIKLYRNLDVLEVRLLINLYYNVGQDLQNWHYCFKRYRHNVFDVRFIDISSLIPTISFSEVQSKMSKLLISNWNPIFTSLYVFNDILIMKHTAIILLRHKHTDFEDLDLHYD